MWYNLVWKWGFLFKFSLNSSEGRIREKFIFFRCGHSLFHQRVFLSPKLYNMNWTDSSSTKNGWFVRLPQSFKISQANFQHTNHNLFVHQLNQLNGWPALGGLEKVSSLVSGVFYINFKYIFSFLFLFFSEGKIKWIPRWSKNNSI